MHKTLFLNLKSEKREKEEKEGLPVFKLAVESGWHVGSVGLKRRKQIWGFSENTTQHCN